MDGLEKVAEDEYRNYKIRVEELKFIKKKTKFKIIRGLLQEVFNLNGDSVFWVEPLFIDVCFNKGEKVPLTLKFCYINDSNIFDEDRLNISKRCLEVCDKKYLNKAKEFKEKYEGLFGEQIFLIKKY